MKPFVLLLIIPFLLCGCFTLTTMQTGRTLGKRNYEAVFGSSYNINPQLTHDTFIDKFRNVPIFTVKCIFGISKNFDLGITIDQTSFIGVAAKYQFVGTKKSLFACSMGTNAGLNLFLLSFGLIKYNLSFPLYLSCHPRDNVCFYLSPRYDYLPFGDFRSQPNKPYPVSGMNITYGLMVGKKHKFAFELTHMVENIYKPAQISVGYVLPLGKYEW